MRGDERSNLNINHQPGWLTVWHHYSTARHRLQITRLPAVNLQSMNTGSDSRG